MIKKVLVGDEKYEVLIGKNQIFKDYLRRSESYPAAEEVFGSPNANGLADTVANKP